MSRQLSRFVARWMLGVLLMGHWAVAAYVCPSLLNQASVAEQRSAAAPQLPGDAVSKAACDHALGASDPAQPNLCAEHCKAGQQSDHTASIVVPLASPIALYDIRPPAVTVPRRRPTAAPLSALVAASPPHAIAHCVRRT